MLKWRRMLSMLRLRTTTLFAIFCIVAVLYVKSGQYTKNENLRQYSPQVMRPAQKLYVKKSESNSFVAAVLVICAIRSRAVHNHLTLLTKYRDVPSRFPIIVSQDGHMPSVTGVIKEFVNATLQVYHQQHEPKGRNNYNKIATHYKWALDRVFFELGYSHVIVTEEDLDLAPDFFSYFAATRKVLDNDTSLWCASAWNDNGGVQLTDRNRSNLLWRTDFFPGLGWMLTKKLWKELSPGFPEIYWDDWMRRPDVRKNRACIRPEVSRTAHNMAVAGKGSSKGLYRKYLEAIQLPQEPIDFERLDLEFLLKPNYDEKLQRQMDESKLITRETLLEGKLNAENSYRALFENARHFTDIAMKYQLMYDMRSGMPRTAYQGVVTFLVNGARVFFVSNRTTLASFGNQTHADVYNADWEFQARYLEFARQYCGTKWKGKCDPEDPDMAKWLKQRRIKLTNWGKMIVI